jgi:Zn-dependent M28 family amino/carboxypeptidase
MVKSMLKSLFDENAKERKTIFINSRDILRTLAVDIGERTVRNSANLNRTRDYIHRYFRASGGETREETYRVDGVEVANIITEIRGKEQPESIVLVGAHYDTIEGCPGADDNGTAVATLLELHRLLSRSPHRRTVRFVAFTLEEPPYFSTEAMGSWVHASGCRKRNENIELMVCLEMLGYGGRNCRQSYPTDMIKGNFPQRGDFIVVVSLPSASPFTYLWKKLYNRHAATKIIELIGPASIPGVSHSDHYSFWKHGYPGIMLTDTAFYRNKNYHTPDDTFETINFRFLADNILNSYLTLTDLLAMEQLLDF